MSDPKDEWTTFVARRPVMFAREINGVWVPEPDLDINQVPYSVRPHLLRLIATQKLEYVDESE